MKKLTHYKIVQEIKAIWHHAQISLRRLYRKKGFLHNVAMLSAGAFVLFFGIGLVWLATLKIPDFSSFEERKITNSTKIYDRTGEVLLYDIHKDIRRTNIPFEEMGPNIKNATVAIEDSEFYNHNGIRISSIIRATFSNLSNVGIGGGGSTITQQLVKNTLLTKNSGFGRYVRKLKEWVLAIKIERSMTKEEILEAYLNEIPYGGTVYGIEEAAQTYFGKKAWSLSVAEAAYLAAIPQLPTFYSPYGKNVAKLEVRKNLVLSRMRELNFISDEEYESAKNEVVTFLPQSSGAIKAAHFVFYIKEYLENKYGPDMVENGGLKVTTTLDYDLQAKGEQIVKEGALANARDWDGENAGLVAIDPKTGQILTMVGSRDYFDKEIDGNFNIATALRQPGSSFKPFIYATAFNKGFTPDTVLFDLKTEFQTTCNADGRALPGRSQADCYSPANYDGKYRGPMKLRDALAQSINIPAVKLFYLSGLGDSLKTAEDMGISTLVDKSRYGLTLVIGGGEVTLLDMTSAYSVFANSGVKNPHTGILKVEDANGNVLEEFTPKEEQVLPKNTALIISDILSDNNARTPTFGAYSPLLVGGRDVAAKTGTTNSNKDAWIVGYTPSISAGVWVGNNDNTAMKKGGAALAGPIWNKFMSEALKIMPNESFQEPDLDFSAQTTKPILRGYWQGNESFFIDKFSGKLATENTPPEALEEKVVTNVHSILYWVDRNDVTGPAPTNPASNPQFEHWEIPIQRWWEQNKHNYDSTTWDEKPNSVDDVHTESSKPTLKILEPKKDTTYEPDEKIQLRVSNTGKYPVTKIDIFINDVYAGTSNAPFNFSFIPEDLEILKEKNDIRIIFYDSVYNRGEVISTFRVAE